MEKILLVIDDSAAFREAISSAGADYSWTVYAPSDLKLEGIKDWLITNRPAVVLLDWQLPDRQRRYYADLLEAKELNGCTLLVSHTELDDVRQSFIDKYRLADYRMKPFDLNHFEDEIMLPKQHITNKEWLGLEAVANQLEVAVDVMDNKLNILWSNIKAKHEPLTPSQRLIVKWLQIEIEAEDHKAVRRLDWDGEKECFLESRFFQLKDGNYWLARDWRGKGEQPHDHEILNLENVHTLTDWLEAVARLLAQRYAISRFRVYKIAPLSYIEEFEYSKDSLLIPLFQSGGGFEPSEDAWFQTGSLVNITSSNKELLNNNYKSQPELVDDTTPDTGSKFIRYGEKGTYRILFSIRSPQDNTFSLFALDRRLDHIGTLVGFDREIVDTAKRMASDDAEILSNEQWSMMQGLIKDLGKRLATRLTLDEDNRIIEWHKTITKILKNTFAETGHSPEMIYEGLSKVFIALTNEWNSMGIGGHIMGITPWPQSKEGLPISTWYIGLMTDETHWQAVAGCGDIYEICRQYGEFELKIPHKPAKSMDPWKAVAIQDFQKWIRQIPDYSYLHISKDQSVKNQFDLIGSWLAVPIQVDGRVRALMVVHSPHAHYFTAFRVSLMENTAERLLSLLAAAQRETRARSAFAASVMHEVKNDSHAALMLLDQITEKASSQGWDISLAEIRHHLEGLNALGQDTLDIFQLGSGEHRHMQDREEVDKDLPTSIDNLINSVTIGWLTLYEETKLKIDIPPTLATRKILLKRHLAFKRVLRVLLHNAFRHGRLWVSVQVLLKSREANGENCLNITIKNLADEQTINNLTEKINPTIDSLGSSPFIRGRLGLAVAHQLATEGGGVLGDLKSSKTDSGNIEAEINLAWPITFIGDTLESKS